MNTLLPFDPAEPIGAGRTVIEASAGTGKTFTVAAAVTRLVAEEGLQLEEILVITFTRAATAELKGRVRTRMVATLQALAGTRPGDRDDHMAVLTQVDPETRAMHAARLVAALTRFDRAQIFTIHGLAQRLLGALGFRVRLPVGLEPGAVDDLLLKEVAGDLITRRFVDNPDGNEVLQTGTAAAIAAAVVGTPDALVVPAADQMAGLARTRVEMAEAMADELRRRMRASRLMTFDDGLVEVRAALADPEVGAAARALLQRRYAIGLVDECQDTDPIQWEVIRGIFDGGRLVVIGDPKQSIYSFRGADVESYLAAVDGADTRRTLGTNWRSDGPLIQALDVLFEGVTFGDKRIRYHPVEPAPGNATARLHGPGVPLSIRRFHPDIPIRQRKDGYFRVGYAREAVAADAADQIVGMLEAGIIIGRSGHGRPLGPADIAVLCRTRKQVDLIRQELGKRDVPSVAARTGGVFTSDAAEEWRRLLLAVERPDRMDYVRLAATTLLVGHSLAEVADFDDEAALSLQQQARSWQTTLHDGGVPALVAELNRTRGLSARVLARPDGERIMTDLIHIAEEMHAVWRRGRVASLVVWLETNMGQAQAREERDADEPESRQRRLETDAEAVQVQTVHGAKGLQYPVVFVPYAWDMPAIAPDIPVFHDPDASIGDTPRRRMIDVGGDGSPDFGLHVALAEAEDAAEEGRLLYVALTRAEHRLVVWWVENSANTAETKLTEMITREGRDPDDLVAGGAGTISMPMVAALPPVRRYRGVAAAATEPQRARFSRALDADWRRASFTSLSPEHPLTVGPDSSEDPLKVDESLGGQEPAPSPGLELAMAELPRGARFGTLVHHVFEQVRFDTPDLRGRVAEVVAAEMQDSGWDFDPDALVAGMVAAIETPLGPEPKAVSLRQIPPGRVLNEMTFELPVRSGGGVVTLGDIGTVMLDHLDGDDPYRDYADRLLELGGSRFCGFLTGAIDLTAALPGSDADRYVVMDYKSNVLPALAGVPGPLDYGPGPLAVAMMEGNYVLQSTLYQVALHRYLQWRLPGYEPDVQLGGSMYLFVRGMTGREAPVVEGERCGVARWRPPTAMILALSDLFKGMP